MIVGNLGQVLVGATDVFIAAKHSTNTLAAISIANSIIFCILIMGMGLMSAISILISNYRGNRKPTKKFLITVLNYSKLVFYEDYVKLVSIKNNNYEIIYYKDYRNTFEHESIIRFADL